MQLRVLNKFANMWNVWNLTSTIQGIDKFLILIQSLEKGLSSTLW